MYKGKRTCKILKEIRAQIAAENDIAFVTSECKHQGDCAGTCPKCEAEVRYLEKELEKRIRLGKAVDTTAAGDTFTGFFIGAISQGFSPAAAIRRASAASAIAVSRPGAAPSVPTADEVTEFLNANTPCPAPAI